MPITLSIDETAGVQNDGSGESENNELAYGAGVLPTEFATVLGIVAAGQGNPDVALSGYDSSHLTGQALLTFGQNVTDVAFTDSNGAPLDGDDSGLKTIDGTKVFLYTYPGDNNILLGRKGNNGGTANDPTDDTANANGIVVFAAYLDTGTAAAGDAGATSAKVWLVQYENLYHPDATDPDDTVSPDDVIYVSVSQLASFSLEGAPSGQNLFLMFGDGSPAAGEVAIVVTGRTPANQSDGASITTGQTVNTGQGGGGTTLGNTNQMVDPGEGLVFSFVTGANTNYTVPNLDQNEADVEANIDFAAYHPTDGAVFTVVQLQPPKGASLKITAYNVTDTTEKGASYIDGLNDGDDALVEIDYVKIRVPTKVGNTTTFADYEFTADGTQGGVTVDFLSDGTVTLIGVVTDTRIEYQTDGNHNRMAIDNIGNDTANLNASFDIGGFAINQSQVDTDLFDVLQFDDDGPGAAGTAVNDAVDEDGLTGGNPGGTGDLAVPDDDLDGNEATTTGSIAGIFSGGTDGIASYGLSTTTSGLSQTLTSKGAPVVYQVVGNTLTAFVNVGGGTGYDAGTDRAVYTFSITNAATGAYAFTLLDQLDHPTLNGATGDDTENDLDLQLGSILQATDKDGDTVTAAGDKLIMKVDDDTPDALTPGDMTIANTANATASGALGYIGQVGADEDGSVAFVGTNGSLLKGYVQDGTPTLENLTVNGQNVYLFGFGTSTLTATTNAANPADSTSWVFQMTLNPNGTVAANDLYNMTLYKPFANTVDIPFGSFTAHVSSGNPLTLVVSNIGGSTVDALFSGYEGGTQTTVNVSQAGVGVGNGQDFNAADRMKIEFLQDDGDGVLEAGEAITINRFTFVMNQNNPPADDGDMTVRVYNSAGTEVQITGILVNGQTLVGPGGASVPSNDGTTVTAAANGLGYDLHGLGGGTAGSSADNDTVTIITASGYTRIDITATGADTNKDTFDILLQSVAIPTSYDLNFSVNAQLTDQDGDSSAAAALDVTVDADGVFVSTIGVPTPEIA